MTLSGGESSGSPLSLTSAHSAVYLCLSKEHRVSRSVRATWFLDNLLKDLHGDLFIKDDGGSRDFSVLSMTTPHSQLTTPHSQLTTPHRLTPHSQLYFICQQYSLVFLLDLSENMRVVSNHTHNIKADSALSALHSTLTLLTRPLQAPDSDVWLEPELCISVLVYCGNSAKKVIQVLLQGVFMRGDNCAEMLDRIRTGVTQLELSLAAEAAAVCGEASEDKQDNATRSSLVGDAGLETMVKAGSLALQLLPRCALKGLVLLTDGVSGFSSPTSMHNTINGMRGSNVSCWVVHVGGGPHPMDALGHIPDTETLQFMTKACSGCVMDTNKIQEAYSRLGEVEVQGLNAVQQAVLLWTFQLGALESRVESVLCEGGGEWEDPFTPMIDRLFTRTTIHAPLLCLVGCKIREGFFFKQVAVREALLEVVLYYPWQPGVTIFYNIIAPWPVSQLSESVQVTISYEGPYSFVHDIHCELNTASVQYSYRLAAIRKFKQALQKFSSSDALLGHFLSFPTLPTHYTLPQSVANGMPLFYFPPNQTKPSPSVDLTSSGGRSFTSLVNFWRPMCTIDTSQWFRWFHSNKIPLVLQQDSLLPTHLLNPAPSGRYATIQCRLSASHLYNFLKLWASLSLLENHSYIRFLPTVDAPKYFCVVRVAHVLPCVVLHVGHIQGTPHSLQSNTVTSLSTALKELTFTPSERPLGALGRKRPSLAVRAKPSATIIDKQLQRVMIRYEGSSGTPTLTHTEERPVAMDYLSCHRWVYTAPQTTPTLLTALLRRRLKEGFLLSSSRNGVVSLIAQLTVKQPCSSRQHALLLQYVIFPYSEHPTTELWVEPQYGRIVDTPHGLSYLNQSSHTDIAHKIHSIDQQLLTSVSTFLYLQHRCQHSSIVVAPPGSCDPIAKSCDPLACQLDVYPGSLFESSRAIVLTLTAFTEDSDADFVDIDHCSPLNSKLWTSLTQWLSALAPTPIHTLTNTNTLLTHLTASQPLHSLTPYLSVSSSTEWKHFVLSQDDTVTQLYLPDLFYRREGTFVLPLVIMECQLANLMDPDPMGKELPCKSPDLHLHCPLAARLATPTDMREGLEHLLFSLGSAHVISYLDVLNHALSNSQQVSGTDFTAALTVCLSASVMVDLTPLLAAFCPHASSSRGEGLVCAPLDTPTLTDILEGVVSRQYWRTSVRVGGSGDEDDDNPFYKDWGDETRAAMWGALRGCGFLNVPNATGYYHWTDISTQETKVDVTECAVSPISEASRPAEVEVVTMEIAALPPPDSDCASEEEMDIELLLSSDSDDETTPTIPQGHTPLFLNVRFNLKNKQTCETITLSHDMKAAKKGTDYVQNTVPLCLKSLKSKLLPNQDYFVSMEMEFFSFIPPSYQDKRSKFNEEESEGASQVDQEPLSILPQTHIPTANALKNKFDWLIADELVSIGRQATPISEHLVQTVVGHVQMTQSDQCYSHRVPLRFVFGSSHSLSHFLQELEAVQVPNYVVNKTSNCYYLSPMLLQQGHAHLSLYHINEDEGRSKTPPPYSVQPRSRVHRRSLSSGYPRGHAPKGHAPSSQPESVGVSAEGSRDSLADQSVGGYEASQSCSVSSVVSVEECGRELQDEGSWLILRPLPDLVEVCLQIRSSRPGVNLSDLSKLCGNLEEAVYGVCHRTNQWFLLKELLDTRMCSPYLLSESASEAWVDEVVNKHEGTGSKDTRELFRGQEFMCDQQWKIHITPHWRLKEKGSQTVLRITRTALDVFSVSNRLDVYVLQDISSTGEEAIFYLKIDESLCHVEEGSLDESVVMTEERPDTRATTVEGAETMSTVSMQPSISEVVPELDKKIDHAHFQSGKPQESLVLQLYGIKSPSHDLTERLNHVVLFKLDDAVLESMCSQYARNQRLRLYPADVTFLQPLITEPSHILSLPLPSWATSVEAVVFYFLQNFSALTLRPNYTSPDHRDHFQVPLELQNAYLSETCDSSHEIHQDHLFLYIRPHHKGRGMGVVSISLVSPEGRVITPLPGIVEPSSQLPKIDNSGIEGLKCVITEIESEVKGHYNIRLHVWEKGNFGLNEFMDKVLLCFKHSLVDYIMELHLLPLPVATPLRDEGDREVSPYILLDYNERRDSLNDELETVVEEGATVLPPSRKVSRESRRGPVDTRRGSNESRRGSNDAKTKPSSRRSSDDTTGPTRKASTGSRKASTDSRKASTDSRKASTDSRKASTDSRKASADVRLERTLEMESLHVGSVSPQRSRAFTERIIDKIHDAIEGSNGGDKETEASRMATHYGNRGVLSQTYEKLIPEHLSAAARLKALSVKHYPYTVLGSYSAQAFLTQAMAALKQLSPDLAVNVFASAPNGQLVHFDPPQDRTKIERHVDTRLRDLRYILIGRNLFQFRESLFPDARTPRPWLDKASNLPLQLYQPLDCLKASKSLPVPLQHMPIAAEAFVPRQRLVVAMVTSDKVDVWLYNFSEDSSKRLGHKLTKAHQWQSSRTGLVHHLLTQKLGLFQHTQATDLQPATKLAVKNCPSGREMVQLIRNHTPQETDASPPPRSRLQRPVLSESPLLDTPYQNSAPLTPPPRTQDPVYNHGRQLSFHLSTQRKSFDRQELLGKVFQSWQSRSLAPVNAATITALKKMARLLHLCCSSVLPASCLKVKEVIDGVKEDILSQYIGYLQSLGFQAIAERSPTPTSRVGGKPPTPHITNKLYKCLQRWWAGGIILAELCFYDDNFVVKLYSLEASRLNNQSPLTPESQSLFSLECARYRDFIHVHSFMMDYHLRLLLSYLNNSPPDNFDLRHYIMLCHEKPHPHFARNLLQKGQLEVPTPCVMPLVLYQYLVVHCGLFGGRTLELRGGGSGRQEDVGLLVDVSTEALGTLTSPQLTALVQDGQDKYNIRVLLLFRGVEDTTPVLHLDYYLLLVHRDDSHPRLIRHSPQLLPSCHPLPSGYCDDEGTESSEFSVQVREHRRRMGLLSTPSQASQLVLNTGLIAEHMTGVKVHLEEACQGALSHMRRDALWKRMVYGQSAEEGGRSPLEGLSCSEFRELLRLVTMVPLDTLDKRLAPFRKQSRRWFKKLILPLQVRFPDSIRVYCSDDDSYNGAAIVNPDWQDMCLLVQVDKETRGMYCMYRHPKEGGVPRTERLITANPEAERSHVETVVNFMCSFLWASILDTSPPQPQLNLL